MVEAIDIKKTFGNLEVLKGINFFINKGEIVSIVGASGAGKTTLLQIIGTLNNADIGKILINDIDVNHLKNSHLSKFRNEQIGFVFQFHHLLPEFTALENVCIPAFIKGVSKKKSEERAKELLSFLQLDNRIQHKPSELSGGEQQRVAVARALMNQPSVILADEPSGNLDSKNKKELHELFFKLRDNFKQTFIIVTHDKELATMSDRILNIKDGIVE
ncbi:MAG: ABC transporter ATP-binding protein [Bacteroidales bacterium]|nr:ABC transporter ATP-binding protein [Bacteroidales bacterium]MBN2756017.1 ABC transporter ATP-binding protein [Bacteroidales bacterium]